MDSILSIVTGISLSLAAVMTVLLARMTREERRRSDARVQLLEQLAAKRAEKAAATARFTDVDVRPAEQEVVGVHALFHEDHKPSPWPRRFAVIGTMAAVLALVVFGLTRFDTATPTTAAASAQPAGGAPLELLSLRHSNDGGMLVVTGLVQNPRNGGPLSRVHATLFVFGPGGTLLTSGRAPLDYLSLTPGDESPFVIKVPVSGNVERYRVGFRGEDDRVIAHVDRRTADAVAQREP
jgi:hypothetical protein